MKLWILKPTKKGWSSYFADYCMATVVVRAKDEITARKLCKKSTDKDVWMDAEKVSCEELTVDGRAKVVERSIVVMDF